MVIAPLLHPPGPGASRDCQQEIFLHAFADDAFFSLVGSAVLLVFLRHR